MGNRGVVRRIVALIGLLVVLAAACAMDETTTASGTSGTTGGTAAPGARGTATPSSPPGTTVAPLSTASFQAEVADPCPVASGTTDLSTFPPPAREGAATLGGASVGTSGRSTGADDWLLVGNNGLARADEKTGEIDAVLVTGEDCGTPTAAGGGDDLAVLTCPEPQGFDPVSCTVGVVDASDASVTAAWRLPELVGIPAIAYDGATVGVAIEEHPEFPSGGSRLITFDAATGEGVTMAVPVCDSFERVGVVPGTMFARVTCGEDAVAYDLRDGSSTAAPDDGWIELDPDTLEVQLSVDALQPVADAVGVDLGWSETLVYDAVAGPDSVWVATCELGGVTGCGGPEVVVVRVDSSTLEPIERYLGATEPARRSGVIGPRLLLADAAGLWYVAGDGGALHRLDA